VPHVVASIEARMTSSRLPGKVLADVCGTPALTRLVHRLRRCTLLDDIVLATTTNAADDALAAWADREGVAIFRGSEDDVLGRVVGAQRSRNGELVVEITGDCILTDPEIVDMGITVFLENDCDVVSTCRKRGFPMGICVQVFRLEHLAEVAATIDDPAVREHVSLYFYEHPERYRLIHLFPPARWYAPACRTQLDYPEDLAFINAVYARLGPQYGDAFGIEELTALLRREPELLAINRDCHEKLPR
jgi:spore coat polysaccharide biosynthesis protein SpsF